MNRRSFIAAASAAAVSGFPAVAAAQSGDAFVIDQLSKYLNTITTMQGNFRQVAGGQSGNGREARGEFYMQRPGKLRFDYDDPYPTVMIADGQWAGVINRRAKTLSQVPLVTTPLYLLLDENIDLRSSGAIRSIDRSPGIVRATAIDPGDPTSGSITMVFSTTPVQLLKWVITDAQNRSSVISLLNVKRGMYIPPTKFVIKDPSIGRNTPFMEK